MPHFWLKALPVPMGLVLLLPAVPGQVPASGPVHWALTGPATLPLTPGAQFTLELTAKIDPGWHLYALEEPDGGPLATEITLPANEPLTLLSVSESRPLPVPDAVSRQPVGQFRGSARFTLHLRPGPGTAARDLAPRVEVRFQACSDQVCLPPRTATVAFHPGPPSAPPPR